MNSLRVALIILFSSAHIFAMPQQFSNIVQTAQELYAAGVDKNTIEWESLFFPAFSNTYAHAAIASIDSEELSNVVAECVMMREGAYGDDLGAKEREQLSLKFASYLQGEEDISFYLINAKFVPMSSNLDTAPCALGIRKGQLLLVMQGGLSD